MKNLNTKKRNRSLALFSSSVLCFSAFAETVIKANNTAVNRRDNDSSRVTADQQSGGSKSDVETTRLIRRAVTKDDSLSSAAKNIKIITLNGIVYLRGPVSNQNERLKIA